MYNNVIYKNLHVRKCVKSLYTCLRTCLIIDTLLHIKKKLILVINTKQVVMFVNLKARSLAQRSGF